MTAALSPGVRGYFTWQKALWDSEELRSYHTGGSRRLVDPRSVAQVIALHGENGRGCFVSAKTVADIVGCSERKVKELRKFLIDSGWLTVVSRKAGRTGRAMAVDISLPGIGPNGAAGNGAASQFERCQRHGPYARSHAECPVCGPIGAPALTGAGLPANGAVTISNGAA